MRNTKGFTLVELIVVIGVIAILAAIATPIYSNYKERTIMTEAINVTGGVKAQIEDYISNSQDPSTMTYNTPPGISVINSSISGATIEINMHERNSNIFTNSNDTLRLVGVINGAIFKWTCLHNANASDIATRNTPKACENTFTS
ncbi:type IV pili fiber building block protein [Candidatus Francisella endociliophora]|uniref:Type IV pili fiber building block protein n=1 Tax=Candidatus Francisella endociliophora TaxID=653937 RepID=A0A097EP02_9GAMM|nr:pilin [Francisella sp. FSC1006]AIT09296.1 type IV pili fiber building block protein [Francisella sp. FSC1006]